MTSAEYPTEEIQVKWRPSLAMITASVVLTVLVLALGGLVVFRIFLRQPPLIEIAAAFAFGLSGAMLVGWVFGRTISHPLGDLAQRANAIARGDQAAIGPLPHHGTRELAVLTGSFMHMARNLSRRSDYVRTFTRHVSHELKTPLTSIRGAAELLRDTDASAEERERFLSNILADVERMTTLLERLSEQARAETPDLNGAFTLDELAAPLRARFDALALTLAGDTSARGALSTENALIILSHLLDNATRHGASEIRIEATKRSATLLVLVSDNGAGISLGNRDRVFEPFFTTRRANGGTGMGLAIARALVTAHSGAIDLAESARGASFQLTIPAAAS